MKEPLELEARERVYDHVREYPGLHLSEIARHLGMDTNHAKYHLRVLAEHDLVSSTKQNGYWRFYPREDGHLGPKEVLEPGEKRWLSLLRREAPLRITLVLLDAGKATAGELADGLEIAPSTLHYHASKMLDAGLLESGKEGRCRVYQLADPAFVQELMLHYRPPDPLVEGFLGGWQEIGL